MNAASSAGAIPALRQASSATGASAVVAQRKTAWPSWPRNWVRDGIVIRSALSPALPQATGPIPTSSGVRAGPTTAAPAPSAKMIAVDRSFGSTQSVSFSAPITSTLRAWPEVTAEAAADRL